MKQKLAIILLITGIAGVAWYVADYFAIFKTLPDSTLKEGPIQVADSDSDMPDSQELMDPVEYELVEVATGLEIPWSIAFTSTERALITERTGSIFQMFNENIQVNPNPIYEVENLALEGEAGLMGLAVDPEYNQNKYVYISYTYRSPQGELKLRVVRLIDEGDSLIENWVLLEGVPSAQFHAGSRMKFGPDGMLYVTVGDASEKSLAQDPDTYAGKILKMDREGGNLKIFTSGHRNPQGIDWFEDGAMISTEHGPSGFDGPAGGDEINILIEGENYGWPEVSHNKSRPQFVDPLITFTPAVAPAAVMVYSGKLFPQYKQNAFFGALRGEGLYRVVFDDNFNDRVIVGYEKIIDDVGRIREVIETPNGEIYFTTSNTDGRGTVRNGDDKIYKLTPK